MAQPAKPDRPTQTLDLSAIILAGGQSSRMGRDKALLEMAGVPLLRRVCEAALHCTHQVYVVSAWAESYRAIVPPACQLLREQPLTPDTGSQGPLVGFAQGLGQVKTRWALLLGCDLPCLDAETLYQWGQLLPTAPPDIAAFLPRTEQGWEPLCGFYRLTCLPRLKAAIQQGERSFQRWLATEVVEPLPLHDRAMLFNCNTPDDWQQVLRQKTEDG